MGLLPKREYYYAVHSNFTAYAINAQGWYTLSSVNACVFIFAGKTALTENSVKRIMYMLIVNSLLTH